jgi:hypothetical protein
MRALTTQDHFTYAFAHLAMRDVVVFKSIVGLLSGRTRSQWQHVETDEPDLLILGAEGNGQPAPQCCARAVLKITYQQTDSSGLSVQWPLRANEVFERLEQAGKILSQATASDNLLSLYKLTRWPTQDILGTNPAHLRLATLLSARALSVEELSERSGLSSAHCRTFIQTLLSANLLLEQSQSEHVITDSAPQGFFARLRAHLGLSAS